MSTVLFCACFKVQNVSIGKQTNNQKKKKKKGGGRGEQNDESN